MLLQEVQSVYNILSSNVGACINRELIIKVKDMGEGSHFTDLLYNFLLNLFLRIICLYPFESCR